MRAIDYIIMSGWMHLIDTFAGGFLLMQLGRVLGNLVEDSGCCGIGAAESSPGNVSVCTYKASR